MDFSPVQIIIVLVIILVVFGAKRLPELGRNLGLYGGWWIRFLVE